METVNDEERATALNEVQILKVLNHPNIVLYIDSKLEKQALLIRIFIRFLAWATWTQSCSRFKLKLAELSKNFYKGFPLLIRVLSLSRNSCENPSFDRDGIRQWWKSPRLFINTDEQTRWRSGDEFLYSNYCCPQSYSFKKRATPRPQDTESSYWPAPQDFKDFWLWNFESSEFQIQSANSCGYTMLYIAWSLRAFAL